MAAGDLNGDGIPDVVMVSNQYSSVLVYLGKGDGTFDSPKPVNLSGNLGVAIGDVNGDGIPDLISEGVYVALGRGNGTFRPPVYYQVSSTPIGGAEIVLPVALRKPTVLDLLVSNSFGGVSVLLNNGKGVFQEGISVPFSGGAAACSGTGDFNGDGIPDLAIGVPSGVSIVFGTGTASSPLVQGPLTDVSGMACLTVGDLNNDGVPDLLVSTTSNEVIGFIGHGDGTFTPTAATSVPALGYAALGDFNGDGNLDFAMNSNVFAFGNGDGTFQAVQSIVPVPPIDGFSGIGAGNLTGDGKAEIILVSGYNSLAYVLRSNGKGGFQITQQIDTSNACYSAYTAVLARLTKSGLPDVLFGCGDSGTPIYVNDGKGNLTYKETLETLITSFGSAYPTVADLNGDGIPDIFVLTPYDVTIYVGEGNLTYAQEFSYLGLNSGPVGIFPMNLHGQSPTSGMPDLAVPNQGGTVQVLLNTTK